MNAKEQGKSYEITTKSFVEIHGFPWAMSFVLQDQISKCLQQSYRIQTKSTIWGHSFVNFETLRRQTTLVQGSFSSFTFFCELTISTKNTKYGGSAKVKN